MKDNIEIEVRYKSNNKIVYTYTNDLNPEILDCGGYYFTIFYSYSKIMKSRVCQCDYPSSKYYYVINKK